MIRLYISYLLTYYLWSDMRIEFALKRMSDALRQYPSTAESTARTYKSYL